MADGPASGSVRERNAETQHRRDSETENAVQRYDFTVSFYGFLHRYVRHRALVFGGSTVLGLLVLVRQLYALAAGPRWAVLPTWTLAGGVLSFAFGVGYYAVQYESSCEECGASFSKERIASRPVWQKSASSGQNRVYIRETFECCRCGDLSSAPCSCPDVAYPRH